MQVHLYVQIGAIEQAVKGICPLSGTAFICSGSSESKYLTDNGWVYAGALEVPQSMIDALVKPEVAVAALEREASALAADHHAKMVAITRRKNELLSLTYNTGA